jgi:4,5-dihydroxyphthalate decarboxylase
MLLADELDALMIPWPPHRFYDQNGPVVRLIPDYRRAEQAYAQQVGFWPAHHLIGVRTEFANTHPDAVRGVYDLFERSRVLAEERRWALADTTPWLLTELEETTNLLGQDWQAYGVEPNRKMVQALCEELHAQGIVEFPIDPGAAFADFERLIN